MPQKKDMMETQNDEANDIISSISSNSKIHFSQLFPVKAIPGTLYAIPKVYKLSHRISANSFSA